MFEDTIEGLRYGPNMIPKNVKNSSFNSSFANETKALFGTYFLQLDLDKENGVTRNDVIDLIVKAGFTEEEFKKQMGDFISQGRGSTPQKKRTSGCSLQEALDFMETIVLEAEMRKAPVLSAGELDPNVAPVKMIASDEMNDSEKLILGTLKEVNPPESWRKDLFPVWSSPIVNMHISKIQTEAEIKEDKLNELKVELGQMEEMSAALKEKKSRTGGLNMNEQRRLDGLEEDISKVNEEIKKLDGRRWW